jgi:tetratricopeptide (TPR) repeat protein
VASLKQSFTSDTELPLAEKRILCWALGCQGWYSMRLGRSEQAITFCRRSLDLARQLGDPELKAMVLDALGAAYLSHGDLAAARDYLEQCVNLAAEIDHHVQWGAQSMLARIALIRGDLAQARQHMQVSLALSRKRGDLWSIAGTLRGLASVLIADDELDEAESLLQESLTLQQTIGQRWRQADNFISLARIAARRGDHAQAIAHYQEGLALVREAGERPRVAEILPRLGEAYLALGELQEADPYFQEGLVMALEIEAQREASRALAGLAALLAGEGQEERAAELLGAVLDHPAAEQTVKERAGQLLAELKERLPAEVVETAVAKGATQGIPPSQI